VLKRGGPISKPSSPSPTNQSELQRLRIQERITKAKAMLDRVSSPAYRESLVGMIGADPALV
jgi:hypothetical protein